MGKVGRGGKVWAGRMLCVARGFQFWPGRRGLVVGTSVSRRCDRRRGSCVESTHSDEREFGLRRAELSGRRKWLWPPADRSCVDSTHDRSCSPNDEGYGRIDYRRRRCLPAAVGGRRARKPRAAILEFICFGLDAVSSRHTRTVAANRERHGTHDSEHGVRSSPQHVHRAGCKNERAIHRLFGSPADLPPGSVCRVDTLSLLPRRRRLRGLRSRTRLIGGRAKTRHEVSLSGCTHRAVRGAMAHCSGADQLAEAVCRIDTRSLAPHGSGLGRL